MSLVDRIPIDFNEPYHAQVDFRLASGRLSLEILRTATPHSSQETSPKNNACRSGFLRSVQGKVSINH